MAGGAPDMIVSREPAPRALVGERAHRVLGSRHRIIMRCSVQTLSQIRALLDAHGLRPKHRLGQNFLHDKNQLAKLIDAAEIKRGDLVLEVGPGTGTLTSALLELGANVIACEIDPGMAGI